MDLRSFPALGAERRRGCRLSAHDACASVEGQFGLGDEQVGDRWLSSLSVRRLWYSADKCNNWNRSDTGCGLCFAGWPACLQFNEPIDMVCLRPESHPRQTDSDRWACGRTTRAGYHVLQLLRPRHEPVLANHADRVAAECGGLCRRGHFFILPCVCLPYTFP